jgi:hypothetical protein
MLFFIFAVFLVGGGGLVISVAERYKRAKVEDKAKPKKIPATKSKASDAILTLFDELPVENRPFGRDELVSSLEALDFKYTIRGVHTHFSIQEGSRWVAFSRCTCIGPRRYNAEKDKCKMPEYKEFHDSFNAVKHAIAKRERALQEARHTAEVEGRKIDLDRVAELTKRLRDEAGVLNEVAEELTQ